MSKPSDAAQTAEHDAKSLVRRAEGIIIKVHAATAAVEAQLAAMREGYLLQSRRIAQLETIIETYIKTVDERLALTNQRCERLESLMDRTIDAGTNCTKLVGDVVNMANRRFAVLEAELAALRAEKPANEVSK